MREASFHVVRFKRNLERYTFVFEIIKDLYNYKCQVFNDTFWTIDNVVDDYRPNVNTAGIQ